MNRRTRNLIIILSSVAVGVILIAAALIIAFVLQGQKENSELSSEQRIELAQQYVQEGNIDQAILSYWAIINADSSQETAYDALANLYISQGSYDMAVSVLQMGYQNTGSLSLATRYNALLDLMKTDDVSDAAQSAAADGSGSLNELPLKQYAGSSYGNYSTMYGTPTVSTVSNGCVVRYAGQSAAFVYAINRIDPSTGRPYSNARPSYIQLDTLTVLFPEWPGQITMGDLSDLHATSIKLAVNDLGNRVVQFTLDKCLISIECNEDGTIESETAWNRIEPPEEDEDESGVCTLSGRVSDADSGNAIAGARVTVSASGFSGSAATDSNGNYQVEAIPVGSFTVSVSCSGYNTASESITVRSGDTSLQKDFTLSDSSDTEGNCTLYGYVVDATTGDPMTGVSISVSGNGFSGSTTSGSDGGYSIGGIPYGSYTVSASCSGYSNISDSFTVSSSSSSVQKNLAMSPTMQSDEVRIVLSWGAEPEDLDAHLFCRMDDGTQSEVYYGNSSFSDGGTVAELDVDDTTGYGPETITIHNTNGVFEYYVDNFSGSPNMSTAGATVIIYSAGGSQTITLDWDAGLDWYVCKIDHGAVTIIDSYY